MNRNRMNRVSRVSLVLLGIALVFGLLAGCSGGVGVNVRTNIRLAGDTVINIFNGADGTVMEVWKGGQIRANGLTPTSQPAIVCGRSWPNGYSSTIAITVKTFDAATGRYLGAATRQYRIGSYGGSESWIVTRHELR